VLQACLGGTDGAANLRRLMLKRAVFLPKSFYIDSFAFLKLIFFALTKFKGLLSTFIGTSNVLLPFMLFVMFLSLNVLSLQDLCKLPQTSGLINHSLLMELSKLTASLEVGKSSPPDGCVLNDGQLGAKLSTYTASRAASRRCPNSRKIMAILQAITCWEVWKGRNLHYLENKPSKPWSTVQRIWHHLCIYMRAAWKKQMIWVRAKKINSRKAKLSMQKDWQKHYPLEHQTLRIGCTVSPTKTRLKHRA
jgi:hypothetical protein